MQIITFIYNLFWGDIFKIPLPGGGEVGISLLVLILVPAGIYSTIRTKFLPFRLFPEMLRITVKKDKARTLLILSNWLFLRKIR